MSVLGCRYCPFYCPDRELQRAGPEIYGHCSAVSPARALKFPMDKCPYYHDYDGIMKRADESGFNSHSVQAIRYYAVDEEGIRSKYYREFEDLRKDLEASPFRHHALYIAFFDANMRRFGARRISGAPD